jgi:hypothetical protein
MLLDILGHTPAWVFIVFVVLVVLGARLARTSRIGVVRLAIVPVVMAGWSLSALAQAFGTGSPALVVWAALVAGAIVVALRLPMRRDVQYSPSDRSFTVPGSLAPLALMMTIFFMRYAVAVSLAIRPEWAHDATFALGLGALSGCVSGAFVLRALRIARTARAARPPIAGAPA